MPINPSFHDAAGLFIHHLRAGSVEERLVILYKRALERAVKPLIAKHLPADPVAPDVDALPVADIPRQVIQDCMRPSRDLSYRTGTKFFKFLIHAGMLDQKLLPTRKGALITAIEQAPDELSDKMNLHQACCAFVKHLWEKKTLLHDAVTARYIHLRAFARWKGVHKSLDAVSKDTVRDYLQYLQHERSYSAASRACTLTELRGFFAFFTASGLLKTNPTAGLRVKKP
ncbi:unnamed protein product, partial [marine sediment metagenome]